MPEITEREFNALLAEKCSPGAQELVRFLRTAAKDSGASPYPYKTQGGWGIRYKRGTRLVCVVDPKRDRNDHGKNDHVWLMIKDGDRKALATVGEVSPRTDYVCVRLQNTCSRDVLVQEIRHAYDRARV
jgi:hypothetical protein